MLKLPKVCSRWNSSEESWRRVEFLGRVAVVGRFDADHTHELWVAQARLDTAFDFIQRLVGGDNRRQPVDIAVD